MANWRTTPYTKSGVTGLNGRCVAQLQSLQNVGHVAPLPLAQLVAKYAREKYAAVDTGEMRDTTVAEQVGEGKAQVVSTSDHAAHIEFGTRFMSPQPFIRPAIADVAIEGPAMAAKEVNREIRKRLAENRTPSTWRK